MCTHLCTVSKDIGINKEKEVYLPNKELINGHRCERTTMTVKCKITVMTKLFIMLGLEIFTQHFTLSHACSTFFLPNNFRVCKNLSPS